MARRYFVIYSGGTIGMRNGLHGLEPDQRSVMDLLKVFAKRIAFDVHVCDPLIDSASVTLQHWAKLIETIREKQADYDGFLIIQGTDTLAYSASILTFFLQGLRKPIVLTGAQYPLSHKDSDGLNNIKQSFFVLTQTLIKEVVIVFGLQVFRGIHVTKIDTESIEGFVSPYQKRVLGVFKGEEFALNKRMFNTDLDLGVSKSEKQLDQNLKVATYILTPGISSSLIAKNLLDDDTDSAILLSYGKGAVPDDPALIKAVEQYVQQGKLLINKSQVLKGVADSTYAQSHALYQAGALPAGEMTLERTLAKLLYILS